MVGNLLGDPLPPAGLVGCGLIFAAIIVVEVVPQLLRRPGRAAS
jgi:hypothetical protein